MFKTILVPLDGSLFAEEALGRAESMARACNATIELLRAHEPYSGDGDHGKWDNVIRHEERIYLNRVAQRVQNDLEGRLTARTLITGKPAEGICEHAARHDSALVVMATHGRTGFNRAWVGSCADAVARRSPLPVLLVRAHEGEPSQAHANGGPPPYRRVIVALDGSGFAEAVLGAAMDMARMYACPLHLVTVVTPVPVVQPSALGPVPLVFPDIDLEPMLAQAHDYIDRTASRLRTDARAPEISTEVKISERTAWAILESLRGDGTDLVALTSHGRGASRLLLGSVADKLLRAATADVLIVRPILD